MATKMNGLAKALGPIGPARPSHRRILLLIALLFILPFLASELSFKLGLFEAEPSLNKGRLMIPPLTIEQLQLLTEKGEQWSAHSQPQWQLIIVLQEHLCQLTCQDNLNLTQQIRVAQGKDIKRLGRIMIQTSALSDRLRTFLNKNHPDIVWLQGQTANLNLLSTRLGTTTADTLFLMDPLGNVMLAYPPGKQTGRSLLDDLKHLFKLSAIG